MGFIILFSLLVKKFNIFHNKKFFLGIIQMIEQEIKVQIYYLTSQN